MKIADAVVAASLVALVGCSETKAPPPAEAAQAAAPAQVAAPAHPPAAAASQPAAAGVAGITGKVLETMDSGGYTYAHLDLGAMGKVWAAGPLTKLEVGSTVGFKGGTEMRGFESKTLNRTFDSIYFVEAFQGGGAPAPAAAPAAPAGAASMPAQAGAPHPSPTVDVGSIAKAEGGLTVEEVFAQAAALNGKEVVLRAKVVKYNGGIMGKNWLHVQDGTGAAGTNDLTVTTSAPAELGQVLLIKGTLATGKDFGAGYKYAVLIEDATLTQ